MSAQAAAEETPSRPIRSKLPKESDPEQTSPGFLGRSRHTRANSKGAENEWAEFFPDESQLDHEPIPVAKRDSSIDDFFPEESKLSPSSAASPASQSLESRSEDVRQRVANPSSSVTQCVEVQPPIVTPGATDAPRSTRSSEVTATRRGVEEVSPHPDSHEPQIGGDSTRIPFSDALAASRASKSEYLASYRTGPVDSSHTSWVVTAAVALGIGLGLAVLIIFGPL